jgi:hypothetical protein
MTFFTSAIVSHSDFSDERKRESLHNIAVLISRQRHEDALQQFLRGST